MTAIPALPDTIDGHEVHEVGDWEPELHVLCPAARPDPEPCDCGYLGGWERRWVFRWYTSRRKPRSFTEAASNGYKVLAGFDERCPGCHDVERFDLDANHLGSERGRLAEVVRMLHP